MQAYEGFLENGRFTPYESVVLPLKAQAILLLRSVIPTSKREESRDFWAKFDRMVDAAEDEEMPEFPRMHFGRELITFTDEE